LACAYLQEKIEPLLLNLIAFGTVGAAILAIWGEKFRNLIAGPKLEFTAYNFCGDLTVRREDSRTIYYHVKIENKRR